MEIIYRCTNLNEPCLETLWMKQQKKKRVEPAIILHSFLRVFQFLIVHQYLAGNKHAQS